MSTVTIGGKRYTGNNIVVVDNKVIIDGVPCDDSFSGIVELKIEGNIEKLECDCSVSVSGNVGSVSAGGSVWCDDVGGNVNAGGSINCGNVGGNLNAGGSVNCRR